MKLFTKCHPCFQLKNEDCRLKAKKMFTAYETLRSKGTVKIRINPQQISASCFNATTAITRRYILDLRSRFICLVYKNLQQKYAPVIGLFEKI